MPRIMPERFRHAAIVGKYQARGIRPVLEELAHFLVGLGLEVSFERETAQATGVSDFDAVPIDQLGRRCDLGIVVGGDGTMLGIARKAGATVMRDGVESEAHLSLPPANLDTHVTELVEQNIAEADYLVKAQRKRIHDFVIRPARGGEAGREGPPPRAG